MDSIAMVDGKYYKNTANVDKTLDLPSGGTTRIDRIGLRDLYPESGPNDALLDMYGLSAARVAEQVAAIFRRA